MSETLADLQALTQCSITERVVCDAGTFVEHGPRLDPSGCIDIYRRAYKARLLQFFEITFPCLHYALGPARFEGFVENYVHACPPKHYSIDRAADAFPDYLAATCPPREEWPNFLIDLARLELEALRVFDGTGIEDLPAPTAGDVPMATWLQLRFVRSPALRLFHFRYPVHTYRRSFHRGEKPDLPAHRECFVALVRRSYRVMEREISKDQHAFLQRLDDNIPTAAAAPPLDARRWLSDWAGLGFFQAIQQLD